LKEIRQLFKNKQKQFEQIIIETQMKVPFLKFFLFLFILSCGYTQLMSQTIISITSYGLHPNTGESAVPYIKKALADIKTKSGNITLSFPKGKYIFEAPIAYGSNEFESTGFDIFGMKNLTIDGNGSEFSMRGRFCVVSIKKSENITLKNYSVDWERPFVTQGKFVSITKKYMDLEIDKAQYPYEIVDNKVFYYGPGFRTDKCFYNQMYDSIKGNIITKTHDNPAGDFYKHKATEIKPGIIRFKGPFKCERTPRKNELITMFHGIYLTDAIFVSESKDIFVKDVTSYHSLSMGLIAFRTENITIDHYDIIANEKKGRVFSNMADGLHFKGCKGLITIENCTYNGGGDDYINVHNMYNIIKEKLSPTKLRVFCYKGVFNREGDEVFFISKKTMQRGHTATVKSLKLISGRAWNGVYDIEFTAPLPDDAVAENLIESKTWNPEVIIRNNRILKRHRAAGVRTTTPKKVIIENNYFNNAGQSIIIEGDALFWLESGAVNDLTIRNNTFDNCLTSGSQFGTKWEWGEAIINLCPSQRPTEKDTLLFHRNITIEGNTFNTFDMPLLYARSVQNLTFRNNIIKRTYDYKPFAWLKTPFLLWNCRNVEFSGNSYSKDFWKRTVYLMFMNKSQLKYKDKGVEIINDNKKFMDKQFMKANYDE